MRTIYENLEFCNEIESLKSYLQRKDIRLVLFAETHGLIDETRIQEEIIKNINPECYLYELLEEENLVTEEEKNNFLSKAKDENFSIISTFGDLKPTIQLAKKYKLPLRGIDIRNMLRKDKDFLTGKSLSEQELIIETEIMKKREIRHREMIAKYLLKYSGIIFVSIGAYHLRKDSELFKELDKNAIIVMPYIDGVSLNNLGSVDISKKEVVYHFINKNNYLNDETTSKA